MAEAVAEGCVAARRVKTIAEASWLETDFVCDRHGRRYLAQWLDEAESIPI